MLLADVNVLVYAFDEQSTNHNAYRTWLVSALSGSEDFALLDTVLAGFVRIVTNPRIFGDPSPTTDAAAFVDAVIGAPRATWLPPGRPSWNKFGSITESDSGISGNRVPDAFIAAQAIAHGARLATADHGFARYPNLQWFDPARTASEGTSPPTRRRG